MARFLFSVLVSTLVSVADAGSLKGADGKDKKHAQRRKIQEGVCGDGRSQFPYGGRDNSERLLLREGVIDFIPSTLCDNPSGKNVILVVGDGMGFEMVRAGAIAKQVVEELEGLGCDIQAGCDGTPEGTAALAAFEGRNLADYYTEGAGSGLSFQGLPEFTLMTTTTTVIQEPNPGNHYAPANSLLEGNVGGHKDGMAPLALDECGFPIDFSPLDFMLEGGNMVLWNDTMGGEFPWDPRYYQENPDTSDGFDPTYIMQHATDSASTAGCMATGHKAAVNMMSVDLYEEKVSTIVEDAMLCGKAGGVVSSVPMFHATPGAFITHTNSRSDREALRDGFKQVNPTMASGVCGGRYYPDEEMLESMKSGALSSQWTFLAQDPEVKAEDFYSPIGDLDPDNGDHLLVCLGGDFSPSRESNLPYRGLDSSYTNRHCPETDVLLDPDTNLPIGVEVNSTICNHYEPEEVEQIPHISDNVKAALDFLGKDDDGFFLMYEQGDIDWAAHANHMDDMIGTMFDVSDSVQVIMDWIEENGGFEKNSLYVTADHDHYLTLNDDFPEALANFIVAGESHKITPANNSNRNPWSTAIQAGRHNNDEQTQVEHIKDFTTWTPEDIEQVGHFWGARGSGGNGWGSHSTRPVPLYYAGDDGCLEALTGKGFQVLGRQVEGSPGKVDQMHLHACMMKNLFALGVKLPEPLNLEERVAVQFGPRPYYLVDQMKDSPLKEELEMCAEDMKLFKLSDFAIGHRGAPMQFPEHTEISYEAASNMGAGIVECDVAFTKDRELVCRHAQCDLHTTTDVVLREDMNAKCTTPWSPGTSPRCCTSDFTLAELKTLCAKMDASGPDDGTARDYVYGGTADWRTDVYQYGCPEILTHKESIAVIKSNMGKFTPELKAPAVTMPFEGDFTQRQLALQMIQDYVDMEVPPSDVWPQSNTLEDLEVWIAETDYGTQAVALDFDDDRLSQLDDDYLDMLKDMGVTYFAPPMWKLVAPNPAAGSDGEPDMIPSVFANQIMEREFNIITWTLDRTGPPLGRDPGEPTSYYWQTLQGQGLGLTPGSRFDLLDVLYKDVGILAIFDDWPSVSSFYANCMDISTRIN